MSLINLAHYKHVTGDRLKRLPFMMLLWLECGTRGTLQYRTEPNYRHADPASGTVTAWSLFYYGWSRLSAYGVLPIHASAGHWWYSNAHKTNEPVLRYYPWAMPRQLASGIRMRLHNLYDA